MRDLIDERNFREKCARSIVKNYNVHYITQEELTKQQLEQANDIVEQAKYGMVNEIVNQANREETPSHAAYEEEEKDPVTEEQIRKILGEREERIAETISENQQ